MVCITNKEALAYVRVGVLSLIENNDEVTPVILSYELSTLFDLYSEEAILEEERRRL